MGKIYYQHIVNKVEYYKHAGENYIELNTAVHKQRPSNFNSHYTELKSLSQYQHFHKLPSGYIAGYSPTTITWALASSYIQLTYVANLKFLDSTP